MEPERLKSRKLPKLPTNRTLYNTLYAKFRAIRIVTLTWDNFSQLQLFCAGDSNDFMTAFFKDSIDHIVHTNAADICHFNFVARSMLEWYSKCNDLRTYEV